METSRSPGPSASAGAAERPSMWSYFKADGAAYPREAWLYERSIWAVAIYRLGRALFLRYNTRLESQPRIIRYAVKAPLLIVLRVVEAFTGVELPPQTEVGPGLRIWHGGNVIINPNSRIGARCLIRHGVTIGNLSEGGPAPTIGDGVEMGAYAQVLGGIRVGDEAKIGAMAVVLKDVPPGATAVGIPARIVSRPESPPTPRPI